MVFKLILYKQNQRNVFKWGKINFIKIKVVMMPFGFKKDNTSIMNENTIENTSSNTTTKQMNEETNNLLTSLQRKPKETKEKNKEKENKGFVHKLNKFSKMREPGDTDMLDIGIVIVVVSAWLEVGALFAGMAGSPIVVDLAIGGLVGMVVGFTIAAIGTLRD